MVKCKVMTTKRMQEAREKLAVAILKRMGELDAELGYRITETEFAERVGCPQPLVNLWKQGRGLPSSQYISKLAKEIPEIWDIMGLIRPGAVDDNLFMPPELGISALEKLRLLISWMKELTEEERLTVLDEALRRKPRGKRVPPVNAERGKRA